MTGAVASERVTEAPKGSLSAAGNRAKSVKAEGSLTASQTRRAGTKVGLSDPVVLSGNACLLYTSCRGQAYKFICFYECQ